MYGNCCLRASGPTIRVRGFFLGTEQYSETANEQNATWFVCVIADNSLYAVLFMSKGDLVSRSQLLTASQFKRRAKPHLQKIAMRATTSEQKSQRLKAYHSIGEIVVEAIPDRANYGDKRVPELAEAIGYQSAALTKMRAFANCYSKRDLNQLCKLADHVSWSHVQLLLSIADKKRRVAMQNQIAEKEWSKEQLRHAMKAASTERHAGGRPLSRPDGAEAGLRQIVEESERWLRYCREVWAGDDATLIKTLESLSAKQKTGQAQHLSEAVKVLSEIKTECGKLQRCLQQL